MNKSLLWVVGAGMIGLVALAFFWMPPAGDFVSPDSARIILFHVPAAILCVVAFLAGGWFAWRFLKRRDPMDDARSAAANEVGFLLAILTTTTGMVFAQQQWGAPWSWDPRQTSIMIQLLIYAAYFALRGSLEDPRQRASFSAGYAVFAALTVPFLIFVLPRLPAIANSSLHPKDTLWTRDGLDGYYRAGLYSAFVLYGMLSFALYRMRAQIGCLEVSIRELADRFNAHHRDRVGWNLVVSDETEPPVEGAAEKSG